MPRSISPLTRRTVLSGTAAGLVGLLGHASTSTRAAANRQDAPRADWTQYKADAGNTAHVPDGVGPSGAVEEGWSVSYDRIHDGVAVVGETVYVGGKALAAVDAADGGERWTFEPEAPEIDDPESPLIPDVGTPAVADGTVYANVWFGPYDGGTEDTALVAVDAETGKRRWRVDTDGESSERIAPVTVDDGAAFTSIPNGDGGRTIHAFEPDGTVRWTNQLDTAFNRALPVAGGRVYLPTKTGVEVLDAETGEDGWTALPEVTFEYVPSAVVAGGTLFVAGKTGSGVTLFALDAATGDERWRTAYPSLAIGAVGPERVYVRVDESDADVLALDCADGSERWRASVDERDVPTDGFALVGDLLYVGAAALDPTDGSIVWTHAMPVSAYGWELSAVVGGRVYLTSGSVVALTGATPETDEPPTDTPTDTPTATPEEGTPEDAPATTRSPTSETPAPETTTATDSPTTTDSPATTRAPSSTSAPTTGTSTTAATASSTDSSSASPSTSEVETETTGPGFGVLSAIGAIGVGAALSRLRRR
ncbi:outer membrane protein assembly factor BamB family protein [Halegenticoccus soli]|uniref:outer membrane protein assembly factor BamB family protein n=1 Tax=Halegenticoccus soli TaxID=1985678 RepID=UPI000C6CEF5C|nr:PQQ-binding-like beta-propeller repeat protein [Halegenticoccus soli]